MEQRSLKRFWRYGLKADRRALRDTWNTIHSAWGMGIPAAIIATALWVWWRSGWEQAVTVALEAIGVGLFTGIVLVALVTFVKVAGTPARLDHESKTEREELEAKLSRFEQETDPQEAVDGLARLRADGVQLFARTIALAEFDVWMEKEREWESSVSAFLRAKFTEASRLRFENLGSLPRKLFPVSLNPEHEYQLLMLDRRLEILDDIINSQTAIM